MASPAGEFPVIDRLPAPRVGRPSWKPAFVAAVAKAPAGRWVRGRAFENPRTAYSAASLLRKANPGYEFAAREGVVYGRRAKP
jgi:hypothetical protein